MKKAVSTILRSLLERLNAEMFRYQVKTGLVLCFGPEGGLADASDEGGENSEGGDQGGGEETTTETDAAADPAQEDDEVIVTIGEEAPPAEEQQHAQAPEWVRELRKNHRELQRKNRELEEQLKARAGGAETKPATLGPKPTLEGCDYDAEVYEQNLTKWFEQKRQVDEAAAKAEADAKAQQAAWQGKLNAYNKGKAELKVKDFDEAEAVVMDTLNSTQQGIIIQGTSDPALVVYALGKNPAKAKELAAITDPVEYAVAIGELKNQLKVTSRKAPPPERQVRGSGPISGAVDSQLERLRADAERTGDYTKVTAYKRQKRVAG